MNIIFYHGHCPDGFCAAFIASKRYPEAKLVPLDHGAEFDFSQVEGKDVLIQMPTPKSKIQDLESGEKKVYAISEYDDAIRNLLDEFVKPAVESDGGAIEFLGFDKGVVTVQLQGACSGCPSSTATLKGGIENLLKQHLPEVTEVIAENL